MKDAGFSFNSEDSMAILKWYDNLKKIDFFSSLKPWQITNRLPKVNVICRKAPLVRLIQRTSVFYPFNFDFFPKSYIIPIQEDILREEVKRGDTRYIVKPDRGSLGNGITFIEPGEEYPEVLKLSVVQEYVPSHHLDGYKFDLRIYALVSSVNPLKIYVFRDGVARFCSKKYGEKSVYSELTNKALNSKNPEVDFDQIIKMVSKVFNRLESEGVNTKELWKQIDDAIVTTIITSYKYLVDGEVQLCPKRGINRCFQILGFDVILTKDMKPVVLEVNYRPSLQSNSKIERAMKSKMLKEAMEIVSPGAEFQKYVMDHISENLEDRWDYLLQNDPELIDIIRLIEQRDFCEYGSYNRAYPCSYSELMQKYNKMISTVLRMPSDYRSKYFLPPLVKIKRTNEPVSSPNNTM